MDSGNHLGSERAVHNYGPPGCPVIIAGDQLTAVVRPWHRFGRHMIVMPLSDYIAVGHRIVTRRPKGWWYLPQWRPVYWRQALLVHKDSGSLNVVLGEFLISAIAPDKASLELRAMLEKTGEELSLPVIDADRPLRRKRPLENGTPEQVFETRLPDELDLNIRELVSRRRLTIGRDIAPLPRGIAATRQNDALHLAFRYSAVWETLKIAGVLMTIAIIAAAGRHHSHGNGAEHFILLLAIVCGASLAGAFLFAFPILHSFNGNELALAEDGWTYRPAPGSLFQPSARVVSQIKPSEIEEIYRDKRSVVITTDREIVRIHCRSRAMATWMEATLLAVAAYGLSVLDGPVPPSAP